MSRKETTFFALATIGFVVPNTMLAIFLIDHGGDMGAFVEACTASLPAIQLVADLTIAFLAFAIWAAWEGQRLGMRSWWVPVPASLLVGLCFALPLFLFLRERKLTARGDALP
jgi:hypothetical protein